MKRSFLTIILLITASFGAACTSSGKLAQRDSVAATNQDSSTTAGTAKRKTATTIAASSTKAAKTDQLDEKSLALLIDAARKRLGKAPGMSVFVDSPSRSLQLGAAAGVAEIATKSPLDSDATFRIASVTKTFTAAAVMRLVEMGKLDLDANLQQAGISAAHLAILKGDNYDVDEITVRQLLDHTSGIHDFVQYDVPASESKFGMRVLQDPTHDWTRTEQLQFAVDNFDPIDVPGSRYGYSDTGYILLGEIIEAKAAMPYGSAMRTLLGFDRLNMASTYLETAEPVPAAAKERVTQYLDDFSLNDISPTIDLFGGGGLISSNRDLAVFYTALLTGKVLETKASLQSMLTLNFPYSPDGKGIVATKIGGLDCWGHNGFWGVHVVSCPSADVTISSMWTQATVEYDDKNSPLVLDEQILTALGVDVSLPPQTPTATASSSEKMLQRNVPRTSVPCPKELPAASKCGTATVPLDWSQPESPTAKKISVWYAHVPASQQPATGTVIPFIGGPGGALSTVVSEFLPVLNTLADRDQLYVDIRGVGRSDRLG